MAVEAPMTPEATTERCVHHWMVEPPGGPTSGARCRRCGEERSFSNNPEAVTLIDAKGRGSSHAWSSGQGARQGH